MVVSNIKSTGYPQKSPAEQSREVRTATRDKGVQEEIQQRFQTEGRHAEKARLAQAAFEDSVGNSSSYEDRVDQMVRAVTRRQADDRWANAETDTRHDVASRDREDFVRERVNNAYTESETRSRTTEAPARADVDPAPERSAREQQRGSEVYRSAERTGIDRTMDLVV
ncbi:MAG: hypothetical protein OEZ39_13115 [Gammaproteobacteria bacterium]|nr:hypothetical protein [Gammaproteobacteria bacterium]MDH5652789.1 hypothetical protein [Gammaproteobacteria bacterium]